MCKLPAAQYLDVRKRRDCLRRAAEPHWVGSAVRRPGRTPSPVGEIPTTVVPVAGRAVYACRMDVMVKTKADLRQEEYGTDLSVLFCPARQMTAVVQSVAIEKGIPWRAVPEVPSCSATAAGRHQRSYSSSR